MRKPMYVVTVLFEVAADHLDEFRQSMLLQAENSLKLESGCKQFDVCFNDVSPQQCFLYEKYDDRAAFDLHLASEHFKSFDSLVAPWLQNKIVHTWTDAA